MESQVFDWNTLNQLTVCKQMSSGLFKLLLTNNSFINHIYLIYIFKEFLKGFFFAHGFMISNIPI